jgi:hypothetical protein
MLYTIALLTSLIFSALYPLCFWISFHDPLKNKFHRFHLGTPLVIGGVTLAFIWTGPFPPVIPILCSVWIALLAGVALTSWNKEFPSPWTVSLPCLLGAVCFILIQSRLIQPSWEAAFVGILSGAIFCSSLYAMNLGHWYLNVHGLPMSHLFRATYVFWTLVALRLALDIFQISTGQIFYQGELTPLYRFMFHMDGFLLLAAVFFGTLFPLIALYFVKETLKVKSSQSATGILYVILAALLLGDMTYKYYLIQFGVVL